MAKLKILKIAFFIKKGVKISPKKISNNRDTVSKTVKVIVSSLEKIFLFKILFSLNFEPKTLGNIYHAGAETTPGRKGKWGLV